MYGHGLKGLDEVTRPEGRSLALHYIPEDGEPEPPTRELYHRLVASLALDPPVDLIVHPHFDVARNLLLYTWLECPMPHWSEQFLSSGVRFHHHPSWAPSTIDAGVRPRVR